MKIETPQIPLLNEGIGKDFGKEKVINNDTLFQNMFHTLQDMNQTQQEGNLKLEDVMTGKSDDTHGALIALEKAELQMKLATVVRDKFVQAYQQIINMQV